MNHLDRMKHAAERNGVRFEGVKEGATEPLAIFTDLRHKSTFAVPIRGGVRALARRANAMAVEHGFQPTFKPQPQTKTPKWNRP